MIIQGLKVLLELEWGIELSIVSGVSLLPWTKLTCERGINGGPNAISAALVPGRILRSNPSSSNPVNNCSASLPKDSPTDGDFGPIWTSVNGGGLGKRGELDGDTPATAIIENGKDRSFYCVAI